MVTIQQLFDKKYSEKKVEEIQFSDLKERKISTDELTIENFPSLKEANISNIKSLTKLKIINCPELIGIICQNNNSLTSLDLSECDKLMKVQVFSNRLELIKLPTNSEKLFHLEINDNNFPSQDLSFLTPYKNLGILDLGNNSNEKKEIYNRFCGSLEPLKEMNNLWSLGIKGTDVDSGLEYLPENLQRFNCSTGTRVEAKVKEIYAICGTSGSNNFSFDFDREKYKKFRQEQKTKTEQVSSNPSKKNKNAKRKEKLDVAQEEIKQLRAELQIEKDKKESEWKRDMLNQDLIEKQEEIKKLHANIQGLDEQLINSNGTIEEKDKKILELISESEKDKEEAKDLLSKKDKIEKELKEKIKSMEERINQLSKENSALFQQDKKWGQQRYQELERLNDNQSKNYVRQRIDWKEEREKLEQVIDEERVENEILQQQVASQQDELKKSREDLQNSHLSYTNFINKTLQIKEREVEELKKLSKNLQNQVEVSPK